MMITFNETKSVRRRFRFASPVLLPEPTRFEQIKNSHARSYWFGQTRMGDELEFALYMVEYL